MAEDKLTLDKSTIESVVKFLLVPPVIFVHVWAVSTMWLWFVVPLGATPIGYWHTFGLSLFVGLFTMNTAKSDKKIEIEDIVGRMIALACVVGIGYLIK